MSQRAVDAEAFLAMVEPPVNIQEELCPAPWAWYRYDDLTGLADGDPVMQWDDRTGNGRHLIALDAGTDIPLYDDRGGITGNPDPPSGSSGDGRAYLQAEYDGVTFNEIVVVVVLDGLSADLHPWIAGSGAGLVGSFQSELFWFPGFTYRGAYLSPAYAEEYDLVGPTGPAALIFGRDPAGKIRMWVDGTEFTAWDDSADSTNAVELAWHLLQVRPGSLRRELIMLDRWVDPDVDPVLLDGSCQTLNGYLASRYPSLGIA